jgi:hypothetical protein
MLASLNSTYRSALNIGVRSLTVVANPVINEKANVSVPSSNGATVPLKSRWNTKLPTWSAPPPPATSRID